MDSCLSKNYYDKEKGKQLRQGFELGSPIAYDNNLYSKLSRFLCIQVRVSSIFTWRSASLVQCKSVKDMLRVIILMNSSVENVFYQENIKKNNLVSIILTDWSFLFTMFNLVWLRGLIARKVCGSNQDKLQQNWNKAFFWPTL